MSAADWVYGFGASRICLCLPVAIGRTPLLEITGGGGPMCTAVEQALRSKAAVVQMHIGKERYGQ